jgi:hypothetical protein
MIGTDLMNKRMFGLVIAASLSLLLLTACGGQSGSPTTAPDASAGTAATSAGDTTSGGVDGEAAVETVQNYLTAKVSNNDDRVRSLLCSAKEADFEMEASSFDAVSEARIENMACTAQGNGIVSCTGQIVATYGTEDLDFPLGAYNIVEEDGQLKWCGEAATDSPLPGSTAEAIGE